MTCRCRPVLETRTVKVPASTSKSAITARLSSPYRQPVAIAACTSRRNGPPAAFTRRFHSSTERYRMRGVSTRSKGFTRRQAASLGVRPSRQARFNAAFRIESNRFAVTLRRRTPSGLWSTARCCCLAPAAVRSRAGALARSACHFRIISVVSAATSISPSAGMMKASARRRAP